MDLRLSLVFTALLYVATTSDLDKDQLEIDSVFPNSTGCDLNILISVGKQKYVKHINLGILKDGLSARGTKPNVEEIYTWSCEPRNYTGTYEEECLNELFVYENRQREPAVCQGLGTEAKYSVEYGEIHVELRTLIGHGAHIRLSCSQETNGELLCDEPEGLPCTSGKNNHFVFKSKCLCLDVDSDSTCQSSLGAPESTPSRGKRNPFIGLSPGSIILISVGCVFVSYLLLGVAYGTGKGEKGLDRLPNSDFWIELPRLVKDGVFFTFRIHRRSYIPLQMNIEERVEPVDV